MDQIDKNIIALLQKDAREPVSSLAKKLGISRSTVKDRLDRLEQKGVIEGYTVRLNPEYERQRIVAHAMLNVDPKRYNGIVDYLKKQAGVQALYAVSGEYDLIAVLEADSTQDMDALLDSIGDTDGVIYTNSSIILSVKFSR